MALGLVLLLSLFGMESALHSVHHLLDGDERQSCELASGVAQADAMPVEPVVNTELPRLAAAPLSSGRYEWLASTSPRTDRPRAPPAFSS